MVESEIDPIVDEQEPNEEAIPAIEPKVQQSELEQLDEEAELVKETSLNGASEPDLEQNQQVMDDEDAEHQLSFAMERDPEPVDFKRPSTFSHVSSKRISILTPSTGKRLSQTNSIPAIELLDVFTRLPKDVVDKIQSKTTGKVELLINLLKLINDGKMARAEVSSRENIQLTQQDLNDLYNFIPDEHRHILESSKKIGELLGGGPKSYEMQSQSRLSSTLRNKIYSIPAVELLDVFNRLPKEILDKIQNKSHGATDFLINLHDKAVKAEISSQDNIQLTGHEIHELVRILPDAHRKILVAEDSTIGEVLKEIMEPVKRESVKLESSARPPIVEMDEATKKALDMRKKIEERTKKINEMKGHLQYYLSKSRKDPEDRKKIQSLKCEINCGNDCVKNMVKVCFIIVT